MPSSPPSATWFLDESWCGIHYLADGNPITMQGNNSARTTSGVQAIGATSWNVYDQAYTDVGSGTMLGSVDTIETLASGSWAGGTTATEGHYTTVTNNGTSGVVVGASVICRETTNLYVPNPAGDSSYNLAAWAGACTQDRDGYGFTGTNEAAIVATFQADQYFIGPQDAARPHKRWISTTQQSSSNPTPAQWAAMASAMLAASPPMPGAYYELPTNEFENSGLGIGNRTTNPSMIYNWVQCANAIYAVDSTAHLMGPCTDGVYDTYGLVLVSDVLNTSTGFLNPAGGNWAGPWSGHNENSNQNQSDIVMLRQYIGSIKAQFATSGFTNLDLWATETGINGGLYGVLSGRRDARQRTLFRHIWELYGFSCQNLYDFRWDDVHGSGLTTYMVDVANGSSAGSLRMGAPAIHEMGENLFGTSCSPTNPPTKVSFGAIGSIGDESFSGSFYSGTSWDLFEIFSNLESDTVTFTVSNPTGLTASDGLGRPRSLSISGDTVTVATDDLCTYVRMPTGSSPPVVVDTGSTIISQFNSAVNLALSAAFSASTTTNIALINNGSFAENNSGITGIEAPFVDPTVPDTITVTDLGGSSSAKYVGGVVIKSAGPAWQSYGCSITGFTVTGKNGATVVGTESYSCASAVSYPIPSPSNGNSSDICSRTTWWTNPQMWVLPLSFSGPVTEINVLISGTGIGGQPDTAASNSNLTPVRIGTSRYANIYTSGSPYTLTGLYTYTSTTTSNIVSSCPSTFTCTTLPANLPTSGQFTVNSSGGTGLALCNYTGISGLTLTGCSYVSGGTGAVSANAPINIAGDLNTGDGLEVDWNTSAAGVFTIPAGISTWLINNAGAGFCFRMIGTGSLTIQGGSGVTLTGDTSISLQYGQLTASQTSQDHWTISPFPFSEYFAGDKTQVIQLSEIQILEASAAAATGAGVASFAAAGTASVKEPGTGAAAATFTAHGTATTAGGASGGNPFQMNLLRLAG